MKKIYILLTVMIVGSMMFAQQINSNYEAKKKGDIIYPSNTMLEKAGKATHLSEDFSTWPPTGWTISSGAASTVTAADAFWHDGGGNAEILYVDASMEDEWLVSPSVTLPTGTLFLEYDWAGSYYWHVDPNDGADVSVNISTDGGTTWTQLWVDDNQTLVEAAGGTWPWANFTASTATVDISSYAGQSVVVGFHYSGNDGAQWTFDNISIFDVPPVEVELTSINTSPFAAPGNIDIVGTITNNGASDITSFDVVYTIDGGTPSATYTVSAVTIPYGGTYDFTHNVPYNFVTEATYTIGVTVSNFNGAGDDGNTADNVLTKDIQISSSALQRKVLWEEFSTEACVYCPPVMMNMLTYEGTQSNMIMMVHHTGYNTDFLTLTESGSPGIMDFFNGSTFAPAGMADRYYNGLDNDVDGTPDPGPVFWPGSGYGEGIIDGRVLVPAWVSVNIGGTYNQTSNALDVTVHGDFLADFTSPLGVSLWVIEDNIQESSSPGQSGATTTPWIHQHTVRAAISDVWGDPISSATTTGSTYSKTYSFNMDASWVENELYLVAFINNIDGTNINNNEVHNAGEVKLLDILPVGNKNYIVEENVHIYPNPSNGLIKFLNVENSKIEIFNMLGALVVSQDSNNSYQQIDLSEYNNGTYIVKITSENNVITQKIILEK